MYSRNQNTNRHFKTPLIAQLYRIEFIYQHILVLKIKIVLQVFDTNELIMTCCVCVRYSTVTQPPFTPNSLK